LFGLKKPKILVEIVHENNVILKKKCPIDGNTVIIEEPKKGIKSGWTPEFTKDSILIEPKRFGRIKQKLIVRENAEKCLEFSEGTDLPSWDKFALRRFVQAEVATRLGNVKIKHELPLIFWLLLGCTIINSLLTLALMKGIRIV